MAAPRLDAGAGEDFMWVPCWAGPAWQSRHGDAEGWLTEGAAAEQGLRVAVQRRVRLSGSTITWRPARRTENAEAAASTTRQLPAASDSAEVR